MSIIHLPQIAKPGYPLGRHIDHDPRSLRYLLAPATTVESVVWPRYIPILNQLQTSACTGNALVGALGSGKLYDGLAALLKAGLILNEALAQSIYSSAEIHDGGVGMPDEDDGSSGLSVSWVAKGRKYISGYQHATSVGAAHTALQAGPFIIGTYWYADMDEPTSEGIVSATGEVRGGHEYVCREYDFQRDLWWMDNSWDIGWGKSGRFAYDTATLNALLANQGDITSLVPLDQPAPVPAPALLIRSFTPAQSLALDDWAATPHRWAKATTAANVWKASA